MPDTAELIASGSMTVEVIGTGAKVVEVLVPGPQGIQGPAGADGLGVTPYYFATGVVFGGGSGAANTTAINDLITMINAAGGGVLWIGPGLVRLDGQIILKSNVIIQGAGPATILQQDSAIGATTYAFRNLNWAGFTDRTTRTDENLGLRDLMIDGSLRPDIAYPTAGYTQQSSTVLFYRCINPTIERVTFKGYRAGFAINDNGSLGGSYVDNIFIGLGTPDRDTGGIITSNNGTWCNTIGTVTRGATTNFHTVIPHNLSSGVHYIEGVRGLTSVPDGFYTITVTGAQNFTIPVNTSGDPAFIFNPDCRISTQFALRSDGAVISRNRFEGMIRTSVDDQGDNTLIADNRIYGGGESGIYLLGARRAVVKRNVIKDIILNDIVASGIEINYGLGHVIEDNTILRCEGNGVRCAGMVGGSISGNLIVECGQTAGLVYPSAPAATSQGIVGTAINSAIRAAIFVSNYDEWPCSDFDINKNEIEDYRLGAGVLTTAGILLTKRSVDGLTSNIRLRDNRFHRLNLDPSLWVSAVAGALGQGVWREDLDPVTGNWTAQELTDASIRTFASATEFSGGVVFSGAAATDVADFVDVTVDLINGNFRQTSSYWTTNNPILPAGRLGFESDTYRAKLGDGISTWSSLPYCVVPIWVQNTPPSSPYLNQLWVDTT